MSTVVTNSFKNLIIGSGELGKAACGVAKERKSATLKLPYSATVVELGNVGCCVRSKCWLGKRHVILNAVDYPHEGGEGRAPIGSNKQQSDELFKGSAITKRGANAAVSYMSCSVLLILFNKAALSSYNFPCSNVITLFQMISSCSFLYVLRLWKIISFTSNDTPIISDGKTSLVPLKTLIHTLPLAGTYLLNMLISLESVRGVNVPMYTTLRRTTVAFTMIVEFLLVGQKYTSFLVGSVGLIILGAFLAGARDFSFDFHGYAIVFLANITTAMYLATVARIGKSSELNSFGLMWCNGMICGPVLLLWTFLHGDLKSTMNFPHLFSPGFLVVLILSCILAFFLNYSIFLNTTLNSAVAQTICGNLKDLFTIGLGWIFFGGLPFDALNVLGQMLGFVGSGLYAYYKLMGK